LYDIQNRALSDLKSIHTLHKAQAFGLLLGRQSIIMDYPPDAARQ